MFYIIGAIFLVVFATLGIVYLIRELVFYSTSSDNKDVYFVIGKINENSNNAEFVLRSAVERKKWFGNDFAREIICIDGGLDDKTREVCEKFCVENEFVKLMTKEEFEKII